MRVFDKKQLGLLLSLSLFQSAYSISHGEPLNKKRRIEHSEQEDPSSEEQDTVASAADADNAEEPGDEVQTIHLPLEALLGGLMGKSGEEPKKAQAASPFKFYEYEAKENKDPYVGPHEAFVAGDLFVSMTQDWDSFKEHADMSLLPLLIYGPKGFGKASLSHTLAEKAKINVYEFDFASKWQEGASIEKVKMDMSMVEKMLSTARSYLDENPESKLVLLMKGFDPYLKLSNFFTNPSLQDYQERLFVIVNVDTDGSGDSKKAIAKFDHFFDIEVSKHNESTHKSVLKKLLASKLHALSLKELEKLAQKTRYFSGDELNQLLKLAARNSLYRTRAPKSEMVFEDFENALAHDLFSQRQNPSYMMMYL